MGRKRGKKKERKPAAPAVRAGSGGIRIAAFLVGLAAVLVFLPALDNGFVNWDDGEYVYENPHVQSLTGENLAWMLTAYHSGNWHPLTWLSHAVDCAVWDLDPWGHHLSSILLHALNALLVVVLACRLLAGNDFSRRAALAGGAVTGLLFALHPLRVESVAWISERKDLLCALFFLLSLLAWLAYSSRDGGKRTTPYVLCLVSFVLALASKPMAVTLPVVLFLLDIFGPRHLALKELIRPGRLWIEKLPFFAFSLASGIVTLAAQRSGGAIATMESLPLAERIWGSFYGLAFYLVKTIWPAGLAPIYPRPQPAAVYGGSLVLVAVITALCLLRRKGARLLGGAWFWYVVTLLPVLGIIQVGVQAAADRYTYLPGLAPLFLAGLGAAWAWEKLQTPARRMLLVAPAVGIVAVLGWITVGQIAIWKDSISLWTAQQERFPGRISRAYSNRGLAYMKAGQPGSAIPDFDEALRIAPDAVHILYNRALARAASGDPAGAIRDFDRVLALDEHYADAYAGRGAARMRTGRFAEAVDDFTRAVELKPDYPRAYYNRGLAYSRAGDLQPALDDFDRAIESKPAFTSRDARMFVNRGSILGRMGEHQRAMEDFRQAAGLDPRNADAHYNLATTYGKLGEHLLAAESYGKVIELTPRDAQARFRRASAYARAGRYPEAMRDLEKTLEIDPRHREARTMLQGLRGRD